MDKKTYELIAIGASIAASCQSWLKYHVGAAREAGATMDELKTTVEIGEMVREKPKEHINVLVTKIMAEIKTKVTQENISNSGCGWGPQEETPPGCGENKNKATVHNCINCGIAEPPEIDETKYCLKFKKYINGQDLYEENKCQYFINQIHENGELLSPLQHLLYKETELNSKKMRGPI